MFKGRIAFFGCLECHVSYTRKDGCLFHEMVLRVRVQIFTANYTDLEIQFRFKVIASSGIEMYIETTNYLYFPGPTKAITTLETEGNESILFLI